jgi:hypothetical protein
LNATPVPERSQGPDAFGGKSEARNPKSEANPKLKGEMTQTGVALLPFWICFFGFWICFGFRASDFVLRISDFTLPGVSTAPASAAAMMPA